MQKKSKDVYTMMKEKVAPEYLNMIILAAITQHYDEIEDRLHTLESKLDKLIQEFKIVNSSSEKDVIVVQEVAYEEAKKMVIEYFKKHGEATVVELHQKLGIKIETLIKILDDLSNEGIIR